MHPLIGRILGLASAILVAFFALSPPSRAADLSKPVAAAEDAEQRPYWQNCYVEGGAAGRTLLAAAGSSSRNVAAVAGFGCGFEVPKARDLLGRPIVIGAFARGSMGVADWSSAGASFSFDHPVTVGARIGIGLAPSSLLYATVGQSWAKLDGRRLDGIMIGGGLETHVWRSLSLAIEYSWDDLGDRVDSHTGMLLLRHRF